MQQNNTNEKHQKHAKLTRPALGTFARNELSFLGTPCGQIQSLSAQLVKRMGDALKVAYVDADHSHADEPEDAGKSDFLPHSHLVYTDKIRFHRLDFRTEANTFKYRQWFNEQDLVLVNGNHFEAKRQIVFIDPRKFDSLQRKLDRLTDVIGFIRLNKETEIPGFLREQLPDWANLPVWAVDEVDKISALIQNMVERETPTVNGLVLAGGQSRRMGRDKGQLQYHDRPQREHLYHLMEQELGLPTHLSCREDQLPDMPEGSRVVVDSFMGLGPFGAILSAFRQDPNRAWLVTACDLPFVDKEGLSHLLSQRDPSAIATAFHNPQTGFPDPLLTLWEPRAYPVMLQFLSQGYSCPRKVLINAPVHTVEVPNQYILTNVNNPEEFEKAKTLLARIS